MVSEGMDAPAFVIHNLKAQGNITFVNEVIL